MDKPLILLTNDDGIDADGLRALEQALPGAWEVHVVAPLEVMSQCGHRITTDEPLRVVTRDRRHHGVAGTPADCVRLAVTQLLPRRPDWVLSGINHGGNLGMDIYVSGTVAAIREAAYLGLPGVAFSHYHRRDRELDWGWAGDCASRVFAELRPLGLEAGDHWNVNLPHLEAGASFPGRVHCHPSKHSLPVSFAAVGDPQAVDRHFLYDGVYHDREREVGSDIDVCFGGQIAISRLRP